MAILKETEDAVVASSDNEEKKDSPAPEAPHSSEPEGDDEGGDEGGEEGRSADEGEYEIEAVLDAKRGYFAKGKIGYLVKWKGYESEHNSWVNEDDAGNAGELIQEYWRLKSKTTKGKKPAEAKPTGKGTPARSSTSKDKSPAVQPSTGSKRGRGRGRMSKKASDDGDKEGSKEVEEVAESEEVEEEGAKRGKKKAKSTLENGKSKSQSLAALDKDTDMDTNPDDVPEPEAEFTTMDAYMSDKNWEVLVKTIDTVERVSDGSLIVYFTLNDGLRVREKSSLCAKRFPQKLIQFYETNLRWRAADES